ncbi:MAG TPA: DUF488 family protein [Casimicrobiaceae bacterium]|nr:DUF488 family protein [Casimicrobiaceae bacterium]
MPIRIVRFGTPRAPQEGPRLGTVRRPPRGVRKEDWSARDHFDVWTPDLAPSAALVSWALAEPWTPKRWARFARVYRQEMRAPAQQRLVALLATLSHHANFAVGCYCADESRCHRSLLRGLLAQAGARIVDDAEVQAATSGGSTTAARTPPRRSGTPRPPRRRAR